MGGVDPTGGGTGVLVTATTPSAGTGAKGASTNRGTEPRAEGRRPAP
jgi:hypothetical protein